jgi:DNA (cytosine-5)-methyltransferase 1
MYPTVSLFSGAGGLDLGLEAAGFDSRVFVEIDKDAQATLRANRDTWRVPDAPILGDILELEADAVLGAAGLTRYETVLVAGGPPCQSFSTAGRRQSVADPRGSLIAHFARMIDGIRPRFFVFENVRGILSAALRHRPLSGRTNGSVPLEEDEELGSALKKFILPLLREELGYEVVYGLLNAADYGVPQTRQRVVFLGSRDREFGTDRWPLIEMALPRLMVPTHSKAGEEGLARWRTLRDALRDIDDESEEYIPYSSARKAVLELVPAGKNWRHIRETRGHEYLRQVMGGAYQADGGKVGFWRRLDFDKPCPTVPASPIQKGTSLCHPTETRPLSVREYARVQQFPDAYVFRGGIASKYRQIGNAVPVGLASAVGSALVGVMQGQRKVAEPHAIYS